MVNLRAQYAGAKGINVLKKAGIKNAGEPRLSFTCPITIPKRLLLALSYCLLCVLFACCLRAVNVINSVFYGLARHLSPLYVVKTTFLCGFDSFNEPKKNKPH
jgi:hypothetical protein